MTIHNLFYRIAKKHNLAVNDHLTRRKIPSYCIPAKNHWCAAIYDTEKYAIEKIMEATGGIALFVKELSETKAHLILWQNGRKVFWLLVDKERGEATYRPDMLNSLFNHLTSKRSDMQILKEMTREDLEQFLADLGQTEPQEACLKFMTLMDLVETEFPKFADIDKHFEHAATKNKQSYWIQG